MEKNESDFDKKKEEQTDFIITTNFTRTVAGKFTECIP